MNRYVPFDVDYKLLSRFDNASKTIIILATILALFSIFLDKFSLFTIGESLQNNVNSLGCILALIYFILDIFTNYLFQNAELKRRKDFFDNGLGTKLLDEKSVNYFSNENLVHGIKKLGVNCFENSFFSKSISAKMKWQMIIKTLFLMGVFLFAIFFTDNKTLSVILQLTLPLSFILQTVRLCIFNMRVNYVFEQFKYIFSSTKDNERSSLIMHNIIEYETTLAWGCVMLDSKVFTKMNPKLTLQWEELKKRYSIN